MREQCVKLMEKRNLSQIAEVGCGARSGQQCLKQKTKEQPNALGCQASKQLDVV